MTYVQAVISSQSIYVMWPLAAEFDWRTETDNITSEVRLLPQWFQKKNSNTESFFAVYLTSKRRVNVFLSCCQSQLLYKAPLDGQAGSFWIHKCLFICPIYYHCQSLFSQEVKYCGGIRTAAYTRIAFFLRLPLNSERVSVPVQAQGRTSWMLYRFIFKTRNSGFWI